jgi:hypothetical protein
MGGCSSQRSDDGVAPFAVGDANQRRLADVARLRAEGPQDDPLLADEIARLGAAGAFVAPVGSDRLASAPARPGQSGVRFNNSADFPTTIITSTSSPKRLSITQMNTNFEENITNQFTTLR